MSRASTRTATRGAASAFRSTSTPCSSSPSTSRSSSSTCGRWSSVTCCSAASSACCCSSVILLVGLGLRLAEGGPDVEVTRSRRASRPPTPPAATADGERRPGRADRRPEHALVAPPTRRPTTAACAPQITHLRDEEQFGDKRDNGRWQGALDIIPTKADYVLDLIRLNSLWPLTVRPGLLRDRDDVRGDAARTTWTASTCSRSGPARARPTCSSSPAR